MQTIINFLRGSTLIEVSGTFPERFINLCAQRQVAFWGVERQGGGTVRLWVRRRDLRRLTPLAEKTLCTIDRLEENGLPSFLVRFRRRYALLIGLVLSLGTVCLLSQFILQIEVSGNTQVPTAQILAELRRQGLRVGSYGPGLDTGAIAHAVLLQVDDLSWMAVNLHGTRAQVLVREAVQEPELTDEHQMGDVVAEAPGIITQIEPLQGQAAVHAGDTVARGDILISGRVTLPVPEYSELEPGQMEVRAEGRIYARTWRSLTAQIPLTAQCKVYTGEERRRWSLLFLGGRLNFYTNSSISLPQYDKISNTWTVSLPGGQPFPFSLVRETLRGYTTAPVDLDPSAAQTLLEQRLAAQLDTLLGEDGQVVSKTASAVVEGEVLTVTLRAECREEIGTFVPWTSEP